MEDESLLPGVNEPLEEYFRSHRYKRLSASISLTKLEDHEEANYSFWRSLTPSQRLELHQIMINSLYKDEMLETENPGNFQITLNHITL
jgi:hypothetical protein